MQLPECARCSHRRPSASEHSIRKFSQNEHWRQRTAEESAPCGTTMLIPQLGHLRFLIEKVLPGKGFRAQPDRAATNGGTLEARRAGTNTAV
jgi:hypothetical protein